MKRIRVALIAAFLAPAGLLVPIQAQTSAYPTMAPPSQYLMADRNAEIALARSAAPPSISEQAEVMVLGRHGYEIAAPGTNHFVCLVERSWNSPIGAPEFWNPKLRGPDCLNPAAAQSYLPILQLRARLALAGKSETEIGEALQAALSRHQIPAMQPGAMSYMLSKQGYLSDSAANWHPHLMFFVPLSLSRSWGANLSGSPVISSDDAVDGLTIFMVPVGKWSDGSPDARAKS